MLKVPLNTNQPTNQLDGIRSISFGRNGRTQSSFSHFIGLDSGNLSIIALLDLTLVKQIKQEVQLMLTNPRDDTFRGQSPVTKHSVILYVRYSFLLCSSNIVFKTRRFSDIRVQKCRDLEIRVRDHSRSSKVLSFDRSSMVSY